MKIGVIGTGYVGLVTGTCLAETGNDVICVDNNAEKIDGLRHGQIPIYEPGIEPLFERNIKDKRLRFTSDLAEAIEHSVVLFLALPTPPDSDGSPDLSYFIKVLNDLSCGITRYTVIVNKSTVPVGTAEMAENILKTRLAPELFDVVSNPEFLREGTAIEDFMKPDRVVIGCHSAKARDYMTQLYEPFVRQGNPIFYMDVRSAEMTKYAANAYLATRISFMNEIANLCEKTGANVDMVRLGLGSDTRIGKRFLYPGIGYGGSCFPKDVKALCRIAEKNGYDFKILKSVMAVNQKQKDIFFEKIKAHFNGDVAGRVIAVWGLSFKPNTDDIRESPALAIVEQLLENGARIIAFDPEAMDNVKREFGGALELVNDMYEALDGADALAIMTEWHVFRSPEFSKIRSLMKHPVIFDGRNVFDPQKIRALGFAYYSIGRN